MNKEVWIEKAKANREKLASLIGSFHPVQPPRYDPAWKKITAPNAEAACQQVRRAIRTEFEGDPVAQFNTAIDNDDINTANLILNQTWFGVPESTECWKLEGFSEAVDLMEDYPDPEDVEPKDLESPAGQGGDE